MSRPSRPSRPSLSKLPLDKAHCCLKSNKIGGLFASKHAKGPDHDFDLYTEVYKTFEKWASGQYDSFDPFYANHLRPGVVLKNKEHKEVAQLTFKAVDATAQLLSISLRDSYMMAEGYQVEDVYDNSTGGWLHTIRVQGLEDKLPLSKLKELHKGDVVVKSDLVQLYADRLTDSLSFV